MTCVHMCTDIIFAWCSGRSKEARLHLSIAEVLQVAPDMHRTLIRPEISPHQENDAVEGEVHIKGADAREVGSRALHGAHH